MFLKFFSWGHVELIGFLLESVEFSEKELKNCFSLAMTTEIKQMVSQRMRSIKNQDTFIKKGERFLDFLSNFCC